MQNKSMPANATIGYDELRYLTVYHYDFDGCIKKGELVCNKAIAHDLLCVFRALFSLEYPINSIRLIDEFNASDEATDYVDRTKAFPHKIDETDFCKQVFESFGFRWIAEFLDSF